MNKPLFSIVYDIRYLANELYQEGVYTKDETLSTIGQLKQLLDEAESKVKELPSTDKNFLQS